MVWPSKRERRSALDEHVRSADRSSQRKAGVRSVPPNNVAFGIAVV